MAKRRTGPGPGYDGRSYDPVYGPAFDESLGQPVTKPLLRRTPPPNPRRTRIIVVAVVLAVLIVVATTVLALRLTGDEETAVAPPSPTAADAPRGQSEQLVRTLTANGFRCAPQFETRAGVRRGCFVTRADTILTAAIFEDDPAGTVTAVRLEARDLSRSPVLRPRTATAADELVRVFGPVVFPADQGRVQTGLRKRSFATAGSWGAFRTINTGSTVEVRADRTGRVPLAPVTPVFTTQRKELADVLGRTGWRCATTCTKAGQWVDTVIRPEGTTRITAIGLSVTGTTGRLDATREGFHAQVANLLTLLQGDGVGELRAWLADQRERGSGSGFVRGWRVWVQARYVGERPAGYELRLAPQPALPAVR